MGHPGQPSSLAGILGKSDAARRRWRFASLIGDQLPILLSTMRQA
ncbi:hypothetical protein Agau_L101951 [Agrobacterium tumefaciens F2]|nr:hypothetical protein Agau_L101951 [Agrobacterium tumefaciens F2]